MRVAIYRRVNTPQSPQVTRILILKSDRLYAESLRQFCLGTFPQATAVVATTVDAAAAVLSSQRIDLMITGVGTAMAGDVLDLLARSVKPGLPFSPKVLVVTARHEYRTLTALRTLAVDGVFDTSAEVPSAFAQALEAMASGRRYWSQSVIDHMYRVGSASTALFRLLTSFEQVVLSVIGDGCDNVTAARELNLSPATVSTVRRELHRKLGVQHRGELVRVAAQHGFVRFTADGVVRPGFSLLNQAYQARRPRRGNGRSANATRTR